MTRRLVWSTDARADIRDLVTFLSQSDSDYADRVVAELGEVAAALAEYDTGRPGRMPGTREKSLPLRRLIISFTVGQQRGDDVLIILHVIHSSRNWRKGMWPLPTKSR